MEFVSGDLGHLEEGLVGDGWIIVKEEQEEHLVGGAEEFVPLALFESASDLRVSQGQLPVQKTPIVELGVVELSEGVHGDADLVWQLRKELRVLLVVGPVTLRQHLDAKVDF